MGDRLRRAWQWLRDLDERMGLRRRRGPFDCAWCAKDKRHDMCTGKAVRPPAVIGYGFFRATEVEDCACSLRQHRDVQR